MAEVLKKVAANDEDLTVVDVRFKGRSKQLGPRGCKALCEALQENTYATRLDISGNGVGDRGAAALASLLHENHVLAAFDLSHNGIEEVGGQALLDALRMNATVMVLELAGNDLPKDISDGVKRQLKLSKRVRSVLPRMFDSDPTLVEVNLCRCGLGDDEARELAAALQTGNGVTRLQLDDNSISAPGAAALADALKPRSELSRSGKARQIHSGLEQLWLSGNKLRDRGVKELAAMLVVNRTLRVLSLARNSFGKFGSVALGEALSQNQGLETLYLDGNNLLDGGAARVAEGIEGNAHTTLKTLWACNCDLGERGITALGNRLHKFRGGTLQTLCLAGNPAIDSEEATAANAAADAIAREREALAAAAAAAAAAAERERLEAIAVAAATKAAAAAAVAADAATAAAFDALASSARCSALTDAASAAAVAHAAAKAAGEQAADMATRSQELAEIAAGAKKAIPKIAITKKAKVAREEAEQEFADAEEEASVAHLEAEEAAVTKKLKDAEAATAQLALDALLDGAGGM